MKKTTSKKRPTTPDLCEVVVILDRSGSMSSIKTDMEGGFDAFVAEQKKLPGECRLTLVQFDSQSIDTVHESKPIEDVPALVLEPRGSTPLLDAVGHTVTKTERRLHGTADRMDPKRVLVMVITDGEENASHEFTKADIQKLVKRVTTDHKWAFIYLGADVDAFAESGSIGVATASSSGFKKSAQGVKQMYTVASAKLGMFRSGLGGQTVSFTNADRTSMGGDTLDDEDNN